jgi:hypothetical protein
MAEARSIDAALRAETRDDNFVIKVRDHLSKYGALRWGHHYLSVRGYPVNDELENDPETIARAILDGVPYPHFHGFFILDIICHCQGKHGRIMSGPRLFRDYGQFWNALAKFCKRHQDQLRPLVI